MKKSIHLREKEKDLATLTNDAGSLLMPIKYETIDERKARLDKYKSAKSKEKIEINKFYSDFFNFADEQSINTIIICRGSFDRTQQQAPKLLDSIDQPYLCLNIDRTNIPLVKHENIFYVADLLHFAPKDAKPVFTEKLMRFLNKDAKRRLVFLDFTQPFGFRSAKEQIDHSQFRYVQGYWLFYPLISIKPKFLKLSNNDHELIIHAIFDATRVEYDEPPLPYDIYELDELLRNKGLNISDLSEYMTYYRNIDDLTFSQLFLDKKQPSRIYQLRDLIVNKKWNKAHELVTNNSLLLNEIPYDAPLVYPTALFLLAKHGENSPECKKFMKIVFQNSDWTVVNKPMGETVVIRAIIDRNLPILKAIMNFINNHPNSDSFQQLLVTPSTGGYYVCGEEFVEDYYCNSDTPLILAIKNGYAKLAIALLPYYQSKDLLQFGTFRHTALHLASHLRMEEVIKAIIDRSSELDCKNQLLSQQTIHRLTASDLYEGTESPSELGSGKSMKFFHSEINKYHQTLGQYKRENDQHRKKEINQEIKDILSGKDYPKPPL